MKNHEIINVAYCILFFLFFGDYTLIILTRPVVAFCISSVFEGLTIFETNPDIDIYKRYIYIYKMFKVIGDLPRIFSSNEQLRRGHIFTVPDTVSQSSEAMADAEYSLRFQSTTYGI